MAEIAPSTSRRERALLADLMDEVGPDAPTLCGEWTTRDLAAHIVMRERRPDGAAGVIVPQFSGYSQKVQAGIASADYEGIVEKVRSGPQLWFPTRLDAIDKVVNTAEFYVHHEDVRRATEEWEARDLDRQTNDELRGALSRSIRMLARSLPVGLELRPTDTTDTSAITAKAGDPVVTIEGPVGEIMLYVFGRKDVAQVELAGDDDAVQAIRDAKLGI